MAMPSAHGRITKRSLLPMMTSLAAAGTVLVGALTIAAGVAASTPLTASATESSTPSVAAAATTSGLTASQAAATSTAAVVAEPTTPGDITTIAMTSPRDDLFAFGSVWISNGPAATVTRLDPATNAVQAVISVPDPASVLGSSDDAIWLTSYPGNSLTRIDPDTNQATGTISLAPAGQGAVGVTAYDGFVWVANHDGTPSTSVAKVDPVALRVVDVISVGSDTFAGPTWVSGGAGSVWVDVPNANAIMRIDPATDQVIATIADPTDCASVAASDSAVWVASLDGDGCVGGIIKVDPATNGVVARLNAGDGTGPLALSDDGSVWFGTDPSGYLGRIDPSTATVASRVKLPGPAFGVTIGGGFAWVTDRQDNLLFKVPVDQTQP
jgi:streptogramin lyase